MRVIKEVSRLVRGSGGGESDPPHRLTGQTVPKTLPLPWGGGSPPQPHLHLSACFAGPNSLAICSELRLRSWPSRSPQLVNF